jgi:hypothetical protein
LARLPASIQKTWDGAVVITLGGRPRLDAFPMQPCGGLAEVGLDKVTHPLAVTALPASRKKRYIRYSCYGAVSVWLSRHPIRYIIRCMRF